MPFEGATTQILAKKGRGRPGQTNIWARGAHKKKLRAIANFTKTFGAISLKLAGWIEVIEAFKIPPPLFSAPMPFEGATTQILAKNGRGRPGQTHIWARLVPITK